MLTLSPGARFAIGLFITLCIGISSGTVALTDAIPSDLIKPITAWAAIFAFLGSAFQTGLQGLGMTNANKVAAAADVAVRSENRSCSFGTRSQPDRYDQGDCPGRWSGGRWCEDRE